MKRRSSTLDGRKRDRFARPGTSQHKSNRHKSSRPKRSHKGQPKGKARRKRKKRINREHTEPGLRMTEKRRGKTSVRRYSNRSFHQMKEFKGKVVELIQIFTSGDYNSISVRFQDKTSLDFAIDTGFTVDTDYTDWKTGNMRRIKRWPLIRSEPRS